MEHDHRSITRLCNKHICPLEVIELSSEDDEEAGTVQPLRRAAVEYPAEELNAAIRFVSSRILQESVTQLCQNVPATATYLSTTLLTPAHSGSRKGNGRDVGNV